jgi:hypothetical protein
VNGQWLYKTRQIVTGRNKHPGVGYSLNFFRWEGDQSITHVPTAGRVVDHVGFEVKNLDAFCKALGAKGIKPVRPYKKNDPTMNNIATATNRRPLGSLNRADRRPGQN